MLPCWSIKKISLVGLLLFFTSAAFAFQASGGGGKNAELLEQAQEELEMLKYPDAMVLFDKVYEATGSGKAALGSGICRFYLPAMRSSSEKYFRDALKNGEHEAHYFLALLAHTRKKFDEAIQHFTTYLSSENILQVRADVNRLLDKSIVAREMIRKPVNVRIVNPGAPINSVFSDYLPIPSILDSIVYFTSRRPTANKSLRDPYGIPFEDIFSVKRDQKDNFEKEAQLLPAPINSETHDAVVAISSDGMNMIIYRTNPDLKSGSLWLCKNQGGNWSSPELFGEQINGKNAWVSSASFSPDAQSIVFSSNRQGGFGGKDLYRCTLLPGGKWSLPLNLGPEVNTPYDEVSPSFSPDGNTLYFSSKGHTNMGGYDIFSLSKEGDGSWKQPVNLGYPINSVDDDLHFVIDPISGTAWFASVRPEGNGELDIYYITSFSENNKDISIISGLLVPYDNETLNFPCTITVIDEETRIVQGIYKSNPNNGKFILTLTPMHRYKLIVESENTYPVVEEFSTDEIDKLQIPVKLKQ